MQGFSSDRCMFFNKMGACRHGDSCTKLHVHPSSSPTVLFSMMYPNPLAIDHLTDRDWNFEYDKKYLKKHFEHFYKEVWRTFMEFGRIAELRVVNNLGDHLLGNVYIRFEDANVAERIVKELRMKKLNEIIVLPELSPVTNFAEACCKEDLEGKCARGSQCNYLHILKVSRKLMKKLEKEQEKYWKKREKKMPSATSTDDSNINDASHKNKEASTIGVGEHKRKRSRSSSRHSDELREHEHKEKLKLRENEEQQQRRHHRHSQSHRHDNNHAEPVKEVNQLVNEEKNKDKSFF